MMPFFPNAFKEIALQATYSSVQMKKMEFVARPEEGVMGSRVWWVGVPGLNDFDIVCRVEADFSVFSTLAPALFIFVL